MEAEYLISFGNSRQYVLHTDEKSETVEALHREIKDYLERKFPEIKGINFYDKFSVDRIPEDKEADYADYPRFSPSAIEEIKKVLSIEVEDEASLRRLNSNDAFGG